MPEKYVTWEPEPTQRGTFSIALTCLATLLISVWSALRLSIPAKRLDWKNGMKRKLFWIFIGIFRPEDLIAVAFDQLLSAQDIRNKVNHQLGFPASNRAWYRRLFRWSPKHDEHGIVVDSGPMPYHLSGSDSGFSLSSQKNELDNWNCARVGVKDERGKIIPRKHRWTTTHGFYVAMGGFALGEQGPSGKTIYQIISPSGFLELLQQRPELIPEILPDISEEAIWDQGKSNGLATVFFIAQVGLFFLNCVSRLGKRLPLTILEVSTVAHTWCLLVAYAFWCNKPLNVAEPMIIAGPNIAKLVPRGSSFTEMEIEATESVNTGRKKNMWIPFTIVGILYGVPHGLVWGRHFATRIEEVVWQVCTPMAAGAPSYCITLGPPPPEKLDGRAAGGTKRMMISAMVYCFTAACLGARLYLLVSSWRHLFRLTPDSFSQPVWSNYFPYIS